MGSAPAPVVRAVIVDDEDDVRGLLKLRLERNGRFEVVGEGVDSPDAVSLCAEQKPDLLVLDALLPSGNGTDVVREVLEVAPSTLVIIYTGDSGTSTRDAAERVGAHAVVGKLDPFELLVGTVFRLLPDRAPVEEHDDFRERMASLLEEEGDRRPRRGPWWRSRGRPRVAFLVVLLLVVLPLLAAGTWFLSMLAGLSTAG